MPWQKAIEDAINALVRKSSGGGSSSPSYSVTIPNKTENGTVTVSPRSAEKGDTVTITAKPDSGYQLDDLTVTDKNGKKLKLTDKGNGKYTFTMPASKVTVTPTFVKIAQQPTGKTFVDVAKSDWFADAVAYVTDKGSDERHRQRYVLPECIHHSRHADDGSRTLRRRGHHR